MMIFFATAICFLQQHPCVAVRSSASLWATVGFSAANFKDP
ncbi:MAG: hypothetical protein JWQ40_2790 [Segetibacter sp.]|nr:hypothetical protein [Segetibacter sp.]